MRNQRHGCARRLGHLLGNVDFHRGEIHAQFQGLRRLRSAPAEGQADRSGQPVAKRLPQGRVVRGELRRIQVVRDDLQPFDPRRGRDQPLRAALARDPGGPEVEPQLVDAQVPRDSVALDVRIESHVQLLAAFRSGEPQSGQLDRSFHRGRPAAAGHGRAQLRVEVGVQRPGLEADLLAN